MKVSASALCLTFNDLFANDSVFLLLQRESGKSFRNVINGFSQHRVGENVEHNNIRLIKRASVRKVLVQMKSESAGAGVVIDEIIIKVAVNVYLKRSQLQTWRIDRIHFEFSSASLSPRKTSLSLARWMPRNLINFVFTFP